MFWGKKKTKNDMWYQNYRVLHKQCTELEKQLERSKHNAIRLEKLFEKNKRS